MTTPPMPGDQGWIKHGGGKRPVAPDTPVEVRHRSGEESGSYMANYGDDARACCWAWTHVGDPGDIVAYRVLPATPKEDNPDGN